IVHVATRVDSLHAHERGVSCIDAVMAAEMDTPQLHLDLFSCHHHFLLPRSIWHLTRCSPPPRPCKRGRDFNGLSPWQSTAPRGPFDWRSPTRCRTSSGP